MTKGLRKLYKPPVIVLVYAVFVTNFHKLLHDYVIIAIFGATYSNLITIQLNCL